jgi:glycine/D-amino acid oxidase-like deaminating enzyme
VRVTEDLGRADVLVIGGGVLGCAAAYHLARRGVDVLLVERGELNREASGSNAGTLHVQMPGKHFRLNYDRPDLTAAEREHVCATDRLYAESARAWATLEAELGADLGVRRHGGLMVAETEEDLQRLERKSRLERPFGIETEIVTTRSMLAIAPHLSERLAGAAFCAQEGFANPLLVAPAYVRAAARHGARVRRHARVVAIQRADRRGFRVQTEAGIVEAGRVVCAAGAQTPELVAMMGLRLPIVPHALQVMVSEPRPPVLAQLIQHGSRSLSLRQTPHGTFVIGGGWPAQPVEVDNARPRTVLPSIVGSARVVSDVLPCVATARILRAWAGMTTATGARNRVGFVGEHAGEPGFFLLMAGGWGFALSPVLSRLLAELLCDGAPSLPLDEFSVTRWAEAGQPAGAHEAG